MMEVLQFVFSSFWTWLGTVILIVACAVAIAACVPSFKYTREFKQ